MEGIDFTACPRVPGLAYNGANGKKIAVSFESAVWILKFPPWAADKPNGLSYSNSCVSEHLGSTIFRLLVDGQSSLAELAPVFDCGSCLLPQADERIMRKILMDEDELNARIYTFPGSMVKVGGRKINYRDFIASHGEPELDEALARLLPRIGALDFSALVSETPYLTEIQRQFLKTYLNARRERIFARDVYLT